MADPVQKAHKLLPRKTPNFISAYCSQYDNGFVPSKFYIWSAISTIAAVLERKVWLPWFSGNVYPSLYIFLVSGPAVGKSSAIRPGVKLIKTLNTKHGKNITFLPDQITDAKFLELMAHQDYFAYKGKNYPHSSAYLVASEASTTFKFSDEHGIVKSLTRLYDPDDFKKALVSKKEVISITNPNINLLAGTTFYDINKFLDKEGILSGFASRCTFVVHSETLTRKCDWFDEELHTSATLSINPDLIHDLNQISEMIGGFKCTKEVKQAWNDWWPAHDKALQDSHSEIKRALLGRKATALHKLTQILSAAESSERLITLDNWNTAITLVEEVEKDLPGMIRQGQTTNLSKPEGLKAVIFTVLKDEPHQHNRAELKATLIMKGFNPTNSGLTIDGIVDGGSFIQRDNNGKLFLVGDPDLDD